LLIVNQLSQREAIDKLHGNEVRAISLSDLINVRDVWMGERRGSLRFLLEAPHALLIRGNLSRQNLQGYFPAEFQIFGEKHLAHPALANLCADFVTAEFGTGTKSHYSVGIRLPQLRSLTPE